MLLLRQARAGDKGALSISRTMLPYHSRDVRKPQQTPAAVITDPLVTTAGRQQGASALGDEQVIMGRHGRSTPAVASGGAGPPKPSLTGHILRCGYHGPFSLCYWRLPSPCW